MPHLLVIRSDPAHRAELSRSLRKSGHRVTGRSPANGKAARDFTAFDAILADPEAIDREPLLKAPMGRRICPPVIVVAGPNRVSEAVETMRLGAADYLPLPIAKDTLLAAVGRAVQLCGQLRREVFGNDESLAALGQALSNGRIGRGSSKRKRTPRPFALRGSSSVMVELRQRVMAVAATNATVLVEGESGLGKGFFVHAVHACSQRSDAPIVTLNCATISQPLIEAELFGPDSSLVKAADGTLYLQYVGDLPLAVQARLASLLPNAQPANSAGEADSGPNSDLRIIASNHRSLRQLAAEGLFDEGLLRRLHGVTLVLPPLRSRREDAEELAQDMLRHFCRKLSKAPLALSDAAIRAIGEYPWPGNLHELANVMERAAMLCEGDEVGPDLLAIDIVGAHRPAAPGDGNGASASLGEYFVAFVRQHQEQMTETELAEKLGISRKSLWERRRRMNIPRTKTQRRGPLRSTADGREDATSADQRGSATL